MKKTTKNTKIWAAPVLALGLALSLFAPSGAQTTEPAKGSDSQKPVINTYDKQPDPSGKNQDFQAQTYDKKPDPTGVNQKLEAVRYEQENSANNGQESELEMKVLEGSVLEGSAEESSLEEGSVQE